MKSYLFLSCLSLASAIPTATIQERKVDSVTLTWFTDRTTNVTSLLISDQAKTKVYGHACSNDLKIGNLKFSVDADAEAQGTITVGSKSYGIYDDPKFSGGISCNAIYDKIEAHVDCEIPWTAKFDPKALEGAVDTNCLQHHLSRRSVYEETEDTEVHDVNSTSDDGEDATLALSKRQQGNCAWNQFTRKVGNGNPHQNFRHTQISETATCGGGECSAAFHNSKSFTISWQATGGLLWISGGFAVQKTWETGNQYTCTAQKGQKVAIRYKTALTAYTVDSGSYNPCSLTNPTPARHIIWSPNNNNRGGGYYCVRGSLARWQGNSWLVKEGPAGGPEYWNTHAF